MPVKLLPVMPVLVLVVLVSGAWFDGMPTPRPLRETTGFLWSVGNIGGASFSVSKPITSAEPRDASVTVVFESPTVLVPFLDTSSSSLLMAPISMSVGSEFPPMSSVPAVHSALEGVLEIMAAFFSASSVPGGDANAAGETAWTSAFFVEAEAEGVETEAVAAATASDGDGPAPSAAVAADGCGVGAARAADDSVGLAPGDGEQGNFAPGSDAEACSALPGATISGGCVRQQYE
jgi:hypothetical protein